MSAQPTPEQRAEWQWAIWGHGCDYRLWDATIDAIFAAGHAAALEGASIQRQLVSAVDPADDHLRERVVLPWAAIPAPWKPAQP